MSQSYRQIRDIQAAPSAQRDITQSGNIVVKVLLTVLAVIVVAVTAIGWFTVGRLGNEISASELSLGGGTNARGEHEDGATDILLVGSDSRTDAQGNPLSDEELARLNAGEADGERNTDTMMVIRVPNDGSKATAVSIPRDTYVHTEEFGNLKINGVYAEHAAAKRDELVADGADEGKKLEEQVASAGQQGLIDTVADLTGIKVDHYAEVGLLGFVLLTDAIGGVDVCLNAPVQDEFSGANFPAGISTLDGTEALAFVRQRHGLPRGDLDRIVRQQAFMASLVNKVLSAGVLTNPAKLNELGKAVERSVVIDRDWDILSFGTELANLAGGNVTFTTIPVTSIDGIGDYGESIVTVDVNEVHSFMDELLAPEEEPDQPAEEAAPADTTFDGYEVHVLNAGQTSGQAGGVGALLEEQGITVAEVTNAIAGIYSYSQVVALDPTDPAAAELAERLGGLPITSNEGLNPDTLIVVTHDDYAGPQSEATDDIGSAAPSEPVGTPGEDFGNAEVAPEITAGGDGPRCVN